jgi:hypothetical protein
VANPAVVVDFVANTKDLSKGFDEAGRKAGGFGSKLKGFAKAGALAGFAALTASLKVGVDEFSEAQKVAAQTDAVLKSTGKAAGVTAEGVSALAGALMKKSGVDDEAIQSGENVLLTFTNIRNEAGKGKDIFDQTTKAALDMSVALGTDMKTASMQLGKALNDPIKGMSKLTKQGVTFTDAQKAQAAAMVKSGDVAGAQALILKELNKEFGGSAEAAGKTLPGQLNILKQEFSNLAGEIVGRLIPPLTAIAKLMADHKNVVIALVAALATLVVGTLAVSAATAAWNAIQLAAGVASKAWAAGQWLVNAALAANPIGLVVIGIAALVAALVLAYKTSDTFRAIVNGAFDAVWGTMKQVFTWLKSNWPTLLAILTGPIGLATLAIAKNWDTIRDTVSGSVAAVRNWITGAWAAIRSATSSAWGAVAGAIAGTISDIKRFLNELASWVAGFATGRYKNLVANVGAVWNAVSDAAENAVHGVKAALNDMIAWIGGVVGRVRNVANDVANAVKAPINAVLRAWNGISLHVPKITIPSIKVGKKKIGGGSFGGQTFGFPNVPLLAKGGVIDQPTMAVVGEAGREIVTPEKLLRDIVGQQAVQVRVFIGEQELTQLVRTEIVDANTGLARTLLAGTAG